MPKGHGHALRAPLGAVVPRQQPGFSGLGIRAELVRKVDAAMAVEHARPRQGVKAATPAIHAAQLVAPLVRLVAEQGPQVFFPVRRAQQLADVVRAGHGLPHVPLRLHARMHHQAFVRIHGQRLVAQPFDHLWRIAGFQHISQRILRVQFAHALRHRQQMDVVIAQQAMHAAFQRHHAAQHIGRIRPAIDHIAQHIKGVAAGRKIQRTQHGLPLRMATMNIPDAVHSHA